MPDSVTVKLEGLDDLRAALAEAPKAIRTKAIRAALREAGKVIQSAARMSAPVLTVPARYRSPGTVKRAISVRASKYARDSGQEGVFINVRPIGTKAARVKKLGWAGAKNPNDPFYWRFLEFGTKKMSARPFLAPAARSKGSEAIQKFMSSAIPAIEKLNERSKRVR